MAEPLRIAGNIVGIAAALIVWFGFAKPYTSHVLGGAVAVVVVLNVIHAAGHGYFIPTLVFIGVALFLLLRWAIVSLSGPRVELNPLAQLHDGVLERADYWRDEPLILSAGLGFDNIGGISELIEEAVRAADGAWYGSLTCTNGEEPSVNSRISAMTSQFMSRFYRGFADYDDGLPIVFSWPVAAESVDPSDFQFTLNTGEVLIPHAAGMLPNWERNERNPVVVWNDWGNRGSASDADAVFPVRLDIVEDDTPLLLIGPGGQEFNAVGLSWTTDATPYDSGPVLVGANPGPPDLEPVIIALDNPMRIDRAAP